MNTNIFVTDERRAWMRLRDHTVIFDREPDFSRFLTDPSGSVLHILRIWVAESATNESGVRHYVGSVRHCECGSWMSHRELVRLFRRATSTAQTLGENAEMFRASLSKFLREYFGSEKTNVN